jgi:ABC-type phosphate transport system substrate-binding protein
MAMVRRARATCSDLTRQLRRRGLLAGLLLVAGAFMVRRIAHAEPTPEFRVIVHPDNPSTALNREFLSDAFLKRSTRWNDGETIRPVDQRPDSLARQHFSRSVLHRSVTAVKSYWQQRIFSGRELPPPELESDEAVLSYVLKHRGAVGYVSGAAKLDRAKAVQVQ